jgi:multicomponent Na+:H+ antiporter subunit B
MSPPVRNGVSAALCALLLAFVAWGFFALPQFGHYPGPYGDVIDTVAPHERHLPNAISAVNFDYRGVDTLGEEMILFAAVAGITMVLRNDRRRTTPDPLPSTARRPRSARSDAVHLFSIAGVGVTIAFGTYLAIHPHLTPGGGFQGAAMLAGFTALAFIGIGYDAFVRLAQQARYEIAEAVGAGAYVVIGLATLAITGAFLANALPLGGEGQLFSAGTIPLINAFVALEVLAGFVLMFLEFANETRVERPDRENEA